MSFLIVNSIGTISKDIKGLDLNMLWIGLTGGLGTGKSTVGKIIKQYGIPVIDADLISHEVLQPGQKAYSSVISYFGLEMLNDDKTINRKKLAEVVFNNNESLKMLESFIHPEVKKRVKKLKNEYISQNKTIVFYDVPLLFEKKMQNDFNFIVVVTANFELQKQRIKLRNNWSEEEIISRLKSQITLLEKTKQAHYVIYNNGNIDELKEEVIKMIKYFKNQELKVN